MKSLEEIRRINASFPYSEPIKEWKAQGKKVVGWICNYVPEEVIYAAGLLPVRLTGNSEELNLTKADSYFFSNMCSYIRSCFELGLDGQFDFLDGIVACASCQGPIRLAELTEHYLHIPVIHIIDLPQKIEAQSVNFYCTEIQRFKEKLEQFFDVKITEEALIEAIEVHNETRSLLKELYELRKLNSPPISGSEAMEIVNASVRMPKKQFNLLLKSILEEVAAPFRVRKKETPAKAGGYDGGVRIMLSGSILNNAEFIKGIEDLGAQVAIEELCTGARYFWEPVENKSDLLKAISRRYLYNFPCPCMNPSELRINQVIDLINDFQVKGVIIEIIRWCIGFNFSQFILSQKLEKQGIPALNLDIEYGTPMTGQLKTRIEAFLEMIEGIV